MNVSCGYDIFSSPKKERKLTRLHVSEFKNDFLYFACADLRTPIIICHDVGCRLCSEQKQRLMTNQCVQIED